MENVDFRESAPAVDASGRKRIFAAAGTVNVLTTPEHITI
jgi:hypothetical protein